MLVSRGRNPSATEVITQLVQNPELRGRVLTTVGAAHACPSWGSTSPCLGSIGLLLSNLLSRAEHSLASLTSFTGGGISTLGVFALGILPFINASIIIQLLTASLPQLEDFRKTKAKQGGAKLPKSPATWRLGWGTVQSVIFAMILAPIRRRGIKRRCLCRANSAGAGHWLDDCDVAQ